MIVSFKLKTRTSLFSNSQIVDPLGLKKKFSTFVERLSDLAPHAITAGLVIGVAATGFLLGYLWRGHHIHEEPTVPLEQPLEAVEGVNSVLNEVPFSNDMLDSRTLFLEDLIGRLREIWSVGDIPEKDLTFFFGQFEDYLAKSYPSGLGYEDDIFFPSVYENINWGIIWSLFREWFWLTVIFIIILTIKRIIIKKYHKNKNKDLKKDEG